MSYSKTCSACGIESTPEEKFCPQCGVEKEEDVTKIKLSDSIINEIAKHFSFFHHPEIFVRIVLRLILLLLFALLLPTFIKESELVGIFLFLFTVFGVIKEIEYRIDRVKGLYLLSKILVYAYLCAGFGNLISHTGRNLYYHIGYYFNINFLLDEIGRMNALPVIGAIAGIGLFFFLKYLKNLIGK